MVVPEKIHTPPTEEISAVRRRRGEKIVSDNSKCIRTSKRGRGVNFLFPPWGGMDVFWNDLLDVSWNNSHNDFCLNYSNYYTPGKEASLKLSMCLPFSNSS